MASAAPSRPPSTSARIGSKASSAPGIFKSASWARRRSRTDGVAAALMDSPPRGRRRPRAAAARPRRAGRAAGPSPGRAARAAAQAADRAAPPAHVAHWALDLPLGLGPIRPAGLDPETPVRGKAQELGILQHPAARRTLVLEDHRLELIEDQLGRHAA